MKSNIFLAILIVLFLPLCIQAQTKKKTKVFLLGVFHFHNPGLDLAKTKDTDILSPKCQQEIQDVVNIIANTKPNKIFFEAPISYQKKMDSLYKSYLAGGLKGDKDETTQVGFRLMKQLGLNKSYCVDANGEFPADSLMATWQANGQQAYFDEFMAVIKGYETETNKQIASGMSIKERLRLMNETAEREKNLAFYSATPVMKAGEKGNFIGADLATEWYKRNIRIYSNILRELDSNDDTIFIIFGASHQSILEHLFLLHPEEFEVINVAKLLK
jgi:hypothetical protein